MGIGCVRVDSSFVDGVGTYSGSVDYSGIDAFCAAYAPMATSALVVDYLLAPDHSSWSTAQGGSLCSRYLRWSSPGDLTMIDTLVTRRNLLIARLASKWVEYGNSLSNLYIQVGNEIGLGGSGGPLSYASNHGKYDKFSDLAGTVSDPGYFRRELSTLFGEGTVPTDADFDSAATSLSRADIANLRGYHETAEYILGETDYQGCTLIAPAFEHQIASSWGSSSSPLSLLGAGTIAARERATYFNSNFSYYSMFSRNALNIYVGNNSAVGGMSPSVYAEYLYRMVVNAVQRLRTSSSSAHFKKKVWVTEIGIASNWIPSPTQEKRGEYWAALLGRFRQCSIVERIYFYRLGNYTLAEDSLSSNANFGLHISTGAPSAGATAICKGNGVAVPGSWPGGYSFVTGSNTTEE